MGAFWLKPMRPIAMAAVAFLAMACPASAQLLIETLRDGPATLAAEETGETFRDWILNCEGKDSGGCRISPVQSAFNGSDGVRRLFGRLIEVPGQDSPEPIFVIEIALNYLLPEGVKLKIDGRDMGKFAVRSCHTGGCLVPFRMDGPLLDRFRNGRSAELTLTTLKGETETATISLLGFTRAFQALSGARKVAARRSTSWLDARFG